MFVWPCLCGTRQGYFSFMSDKRFSQNGYYHPHLPGVNKPAHKGVGSFGAMDSVDKTQSAEALYTNPHKLISSANTH